MQREEVRAVQKAASAKNTLDGPPLAQKPHSETVPKPHTHSQTQTGTRLAGRARITPGVEGTLTNCSARLREHNSMNRGRRAGEELDIKAGEEERRRAV